MIRARITVVAAILMECLLVIVACEAVAADDKIQGALESGASLRTDAAPLFSKQVTFLEGFHNIKIRTDTKALQEAGIDVDQRLPTVNIQNVPLRAALVLMLHPMGLMYVPQTESLVLTTPKGASLLTNSKRSGEKTPLPAMTPEARARVQRVVDALQSPTEMEFIDTPLSDVIAYITDRHQIRIYLDTRGLATAQMDPNPTITLELKGMSLHSCLRLMLREKGLTYAFGEGFVLITTPAESKRWLKEPIRLKVDGATPAVAKTAAMSGNEERIKESLKTNSKVEFRDTPLEDVLDYLGDQHKIEIVVDVKALRDARIRLDARITQDLIEASLETVLDRTLRGLGLTHVVQDEVLLITTAKERARGAPQK